MFAENLQSFVFVWRAKLEIYIADIVSMEFVQLPYNYNPMHGSFSAKHLNRYNAFSLICTT